MGFAPAIQPDPVVQPVKSEAALVVLGDAPVTRLGVAEDSLEPEVCSVNKNSPVSPAKRTTRVGIFDVTQNGRGRGPWVDLPWGGAKPLPKPF